MKKFSRIVVGVAGVMLLVPVGFASAASVSIQSLQPGNTVLANTLVGFMIVPTGFSAQSYQLSDSFGALSSASSDNISRSGNFSWVPKRIDAGLHTFTVVASNYAGDTATTSLSITVLPPPSVSITAVSPQGSIMTGTKFSFVVSAIGFTNPTYSVSDSFGASSANLVNIDSSGSFSWTPDASENGEHQITIYVYDSLGHSASASQSLQVGGGPTLSIQLLTPGARVSFGTMVSFTMGALNYMPTSFSLSDSFAGTSLDNNSITTSGIFSWVPRVSDVGVHTILVKGTVGVYGKSATTTQTITVVGVGVSTSTPLVVSTTTTSSTSTSTPHAPTAVATTASVAPSSTGDRYVFLNFIGLGEDTTDGADVLELQKRLAALGLFKRSMNGYFGRATEQAVKRFQRAHGLNVTGFVGFDTRTALNKK